ncbi:hypothetical protein BB561_003461 [Smittium simulii]|uniref:Uncharacterized protein n=1 Tax=Smittium simulii TaxID=133385 RepID=A0A2T9YLA9_9FUNG|nr:hypothetical protein BB561_003461 [Smittium simulii]
MQESELINIIKNLSKKVKHLYLKRQQQNQQTNSNVIVLETTSNDPFIKTRMIMTKLEAYPELLQTITAMQKKNFCSPMTEKERKDIIYSCSKVTGLNYTFPQLNDIASNTVKKLGSQLYVIQLNLAKMTRPIDYFVYSRMKNNPGAKPESDDVLEFIEIMRKLTKNQWVREILEKYFKILFKKTETTTQSSNSATNSPSVVTPALRADVYILDHSLSLLQAKNDQGSKQGNNRKSCSINNKECNRESKKQIKRSLFKSLYNTKKDGQFKVSIKPKKIKRIYRRKELQNVIIGFNMQTSQKKRLYNIFRSRRCISSHINLHILPKIPEICMERQTIPTRSLHFDLFLSPRVQRDLLQEHGFSVQQTYGAWVQDQALKFIPGPITVNKSFRYDYQHEINNTQVEDVERSILFTIESKYRKYYRQAEAHKRKRIDCCLQSLIFISSGMPFGSSLFRQHYYNDVRQKIWRRNIKTTVKDIGEYMDTLLENKNKAANSIYFITDKPCGCFQQFYSTNGIQNYGLHDEDLFASHLNKKTELNYKNNSNNSNSILEIRDMRKIPALKEQGIEANAWKASGVPSKTKVSCDKSISRSNLNYGRSSTKRISKIHR